MEFPIDLISRIVDIQSSVPDVQLKLSRVGIRNLRLNIPVIEENSTFISSSVDLFIDLPSNRRGAHLSRNPESVCEVLKEQKEIKLNQVVNLCEKIALKLLSKHDYSCRAEVRLKGELMMPPSLGKGELGEPYKIFSFVTAVRRDGVIEVSRAVGVNVIGLTSCPCTQNLLRTFIENSLSRKGYRNEEVKRILKDILIPTHTQRTTTSAFLQIPKDSLIDIKRLVELIEDSMSERTYAVLKRPAEASTVISALKKALFVEDVVRRVLLALVKEFRGFPDNVKVLVRVCSNESVHKYDIFAERLATFRELRKELNLTI